MEITFELVHLLNLDSGPTNYCDWVVFRKEDWRKVTPAVEDNKDKEWNHDDCRYNEKIFFGESCFDNPSIQALTTL